MENIDNIIKKLESEIQSTQVGIEKNESLERLKQIALTYKGEDKIISFQDIAEKIKTQKDEIKIMSGWKGLDEILKGFRLQQVVVVSALTKSGKTSFLMDLTTHIKDYNPMWLPFEESAEELMRKFIERGEEVPHGFTPEAMKGNTMDWIETKIVESIAKYNTQVVFIDQLDFIVEMTKDDHSLRIGQTMRKLKQIAKKWNVVIFLICHLTKTKMDTQPTLEELKGSSSIGQEADTVIILWREARRERGQMVITNNINVSVQANRRTGSTGNVPMIYDKGHFIEVDWNPVDDNDVEDLYEKSK
jgi:replicative DNA helicase